MAYVKMERKKKQFIIRRQEILCIECCRAGTPQQIY